MHGPYRIDHLTAFSVTFMGDTCRPSFDTLCKRLKDPLTVELAFFRLIPSFICKIGVQSPLCLHY